MTKTAEPVVVSDGLVVSMDYRLNLDNGERVDDSEDGGPLEFLQGNGQIIPGLERELYGMAIGDEKDVVVAPADGYGERDPEAFEDVPVTAFPPEMQGTLETGMPLQTHDGTGEVIVVYVSEIGPETVRVDFNHPLAGEKLHFQVKIAGLRKPTAEELAHGHAHGHAHESADSE